MEISKITTQDFLGFSGVREFHVDKRNLILGENGTGKTSLLESVQFAMTGRTKRTGKSLASCAGLINTHASETVVQITIPDPAATIGHRVSSGSKMSEQALLNGLPAASLAEGERARREFVGACPVMFDLGEFMDLSPAKRMDWLADVLAAGQTDAATILLKAMEGIAGPSTVAMAMAQAGPQNALAMLWDSVVTSPVQKNLLVGLQAFLVESLPKSSLKAIYEKAHRDFLDVRAKRQQAEKALKGAVVAGFVSPEQLAELKVQEDQIDAEISKYSKEIGTMEEATAQLQVRVKEIERLDEALVLTQKREAQAKKELVVPIAEAPAKMKAWDDECLSKRMGIQQKMAANAADQATLGLIGLPEEWHHEGLCMGCGRPLTPEAAKARYEEIVGRIQARQVEIASVNLEVQAMAERLHQVSQALSMIEWAADNVDKILAERKKWIDIRPDVAPVGPMQERLKVLDHKKRGIQAKREMMAKDLGAAQLRAKLQLEVAELMEAEGVHKAFDEAVRSAYHDPIAAGLGELEALINGLLKGWACKLQLEGESLQITMKTDRVPFEWLSGGQQVIVGAALAAALVLRLDPPLKVLLIDAGEVDGKHLEALLAAMGAESWDAIDTLFVASHLSFEGELEGWRVLCL